MSRGTFSPWHLPLSLPKRSSMSGPATNPNGKGLANLHRALRLHLIPQLLRSSKSPIPFHPLRNRLLLLSHQEPRSHLTSVPQVGDTKVGLEKIA
jgi:hypothetical protein